MSEQRLPAGAAQQVEGSEGVGGVGIAGLVSVRAILSREEGGRLEGI